jgi:hypothetical protein
MTPFKELEHTLIYFGYEKLEARKLTEQIILNLENYARIIEIVGKRTGRI